MEIRTAKAEGEVLFCQCRLKYSYSCGVFVVADVNMLDPRHTHHSSETGIHTAGYIVIPTHSADL